MNYTKLNIADNEEEAGEKEDEEEAGEEEAGEKEAEEEVDWENSGEKWE